MPSGKALLRPDLFPSTPRTWLIARLRQPGGPHGDVNHCIMSIYARPLRAYVRGSSFRDLADADELVNGFFASRLADPDYLPAWRASGLLLRRWLMNGILLFLHEQARAARRANRAQSLPLDLASAPDSAFERAYAVTLVREAMEATERDLRDDDMSMHWQAFHARHTGPHACAAFRSQHNLTAGQFHHLVRMATARFRKWLVDLVVLDGVHREEADGEIQRLIRSLRH